MKCTWARSLLLACVLVGLGFRVPAQDNNSTALQRLPDHSGAGWNTAANRWRLTAIDPRSQIDTVSPQIRAQRNSFWNGPLQTAYDASVHSAASFSGGQVFLKSDPEIPNIPNSVWVIATFQGFHVFAIDTAQHLVYTEINLQVENVISKPEGLSLSAGSSIDIGISGGRIKSPSGNVVNSGLQPRQYDFQLGHKYLLQLLYEPQGRFFLPQKRWDLTSGVVKPDQAQELDRVARGDAVIDGMTEQDVKNYLTSVLSSERE